MQWHLHRWVAECSWRGVERKECKSHVFNWQERAMNNKLGKSTRKKQTETSGWIE